MLSQNREYLLLCLNSADIAVELWGTVDDSLDRLDTQTASLSYPNWQFMMGGLNVVDNYSLRPHEAFAARFVRAHGWHEEIALPRVAGNTARHSEHTTPACVCGHHLPALGHVRHKH